MSQARRPDHLQLPQLRLAVQAIEEGVDHLPAVGAVNQFPEESSRKIMGSKSTTIPRHPRLFRTLSHSFSHGGEAPEKPSPPAQQQAKRA